MRSPANMQIIQIEITNACVHRCSNCTRFCGHHKKNFFMDFKDFTNAVDSLKDYPGTVGIMGGEPTLHPQFAQFVCYLKEQRPDQSPFSIFRHPVRDFNSFHSSRLTHLHGRKRGLWSALGNKYYDNFELIQDTFAYQCINDHRNTGLHQALLITRKELGIPDKEWNILRDKCWIQNEWSASITPKGAFFCEVAAALDMLFDGPGGWPVEPGWWKRRPEDFQDQLHWCELCSAALPVPSNPGNEEMDIISPLLLEKLKKQGGSYKVSHGHFHILDPHSYNRKNYSVNHSIEPYLTNADRRVSQDTSSTLFPKEVAICFPAENGASSATISSSAAERLKFNDWLLIVNDPSISLEKLVKNIKNLIFNPGICYYAPKNKFILIHRNATALKECKQIVLDQSLIHLYQKKKQYLWRNWQNPDRIQFMERLPRFAERLFWFIYRNSRFIIQRWHKI